MKTSDFDYFLPQELIAQTPTEPRDHSKLMVVDRMTGAFEHGKFFSIKDHIGEGDLLVFNDSRVIPARIYVNRVGTGGKAELLLLQRLEPDVWRSLVRPGRRMRVGLEFEAFNGATKIKGRIIKIEEDGSRVIKFSDDNLLKHIGVMPLPPYINKSLENPERYQTVYSAREGSVAAPTAGLHFTNDLMKQLEDIGVKLTFLTLHIGLDTFQPIKEENALDHKIHTEYWELDKKTADLINETKNRKGRVIAVGTTSVRVLEQAAQLSKGPEIQPGAGWADLFIYPGYQFKIVDAMITNFHLPRSTLLLLVSAFGTKDLIFKAYKDAVVNSYSFYSFGDAMMIV